jgi:hypothetical protein
MKFSKWMPSVIGLTLAASAAAETQITPVVDFAKVNTQVQAVIDQTFSADDVLEAISFRVNPKTADLEKMKLDALLTATAKQSPWAQNDKTVLKLSVKSTASKIVKEKVPVSVQVQAGFQTQALKLIRFVAKKAVKSFNQPSAPEELPAYQKAISALSHLENVASLNEVYADFVELRQALLEWERLAEARNRNGEDSFIANIDLESQVTNGVTKEILVSYRESLPVFGIKLKNIGIKIDDSGVFGGLTAMLSFHRTEFERRVRTTREECLKIQASEERAMNDVKGNIQGWAESAKSILRDWSN